MELKNSNISFVGTGRLAYSLAGHLIKYGFNILSASNRTEAAAAEFAHRFRIKSFSRFNGEIPKESDVIFLTVSDQAIESVAEKIASHNKNLKGKIFVHFSGALNSSVLESLKKKKALIASFHIMQTFPSKKMVNIRNSYFAIETSDETLLFSLFNFAGQLKLRPFRITPENKSLYHLTGVFSSNFLLSHFYNSQKIFKESKIEGVAYLNLFGNIIDETIRNIKTNSLKDSVSGPVLRGDLNTIKGHVTLLKRKKEWLLLMNYLTESLTILKLLSAEKQDAEKLTLLKNHLIKELKITAKLV